MKILVTGGAGYIGAITAKELMSSGHEALVFDHFISHDPAKLGDIPHVKGDLLDAAIELAIVANGDHAGLDVVTWAPTSSARRRSRGFDQAELIARAERIAVGCPFCKVMLADGAQDLLSFHYQLAYLGRLAEGVSLGVASGKKYERSSGIFD